MKKIFYILTFVFSLTSVSFAQDDQQQGGRLREKMVEYIQDKLALTKTEAEKFTPVFIDYFKELRKTNQDFRGDRLVLQQKVAELRLRYREQFKPIVGEKRSNDVYTYEREFIKKAQEELQDRLQTRQEKPGKKGFRP
ncbi:MAG: hypothetical protein ACJ749_10940 [Flavisolibacter sp.]